jgi:uncharacterized hydantoinase/oxoprolinase family protein
MLDVFLVLGDIAEDPADLNTANGQPATIAAARDRLARTLCADETEIMPEEVLIVAQSIAAAQQRQLDGAVNLVLSRQHGSCDVVILAGEGSFVAERVLGAIHGLRQTQRLSFASVLGPQHSRAAAAFALARLARERGSAALDALATT